MNRNLEAPGLAVFQSVSQKLVWPELPIAGLSMAAFSDDGITDENELLPLLPGLEAAQANAKSDAHERRHFIMRRCFQRVFVASVIDWQKPLSELRMQHRLDTMPLCLDAPGLRLSFSSSGATALAAAARNREIGIDIEKVRSVNDVPALAARFFSPGEAAAIAAAPQNEQNSLFLHAWTAKEAGLKAIGKGIDQGLNRFTVVLRNSAYGVELESDYGVAPAWQLLYPDVLPHVIVAIMHRPLDL
jgi:phosphopantetheinyl transferase